MKSNIESKEGINKINTPYIGITGFMHREEIEQLIPLFENSNKLLMAGVLVSDKTLRDLTNKYPYMYPKVENISKIIVDHPSVINLIHFSSDYPGYMDQQMISITQNHPLIEGFQLNFNWPSQQILYNYRNMYPNKRIVLQIGKASIAAFSTNPFQVAEYLTTYKDLIDDILLDSSGGKGELFDPNKAYTYLYEIKNRNPHIGIGVAGGLSPNTISYAKNLTMFFPNLSVDAQGRLRNKDGSLNLSKCKEYVEGMLI